MMKFNVFALAAGLLLSSTAAFAATSNPTGDDLRKAVAGKTVYLNVSGFELPMHYSPGGMLSGSMGVVAASMSTGSGASDHGRWWVANDQLCQKWTAWLDGKTYCFKLSLQGKTVHWVRNDGMTGTARIGG